MDEYGDPINPTWEVVDKIDKSSLRNPNYKGINTSFKYASGAETKSGYDALNSYDKGFIPGYDNQEANRARNKQAEFESYIPFVGITIFCILIFIFVKKALFNPLIKSANYHFPDIIVRKSDNIEFRLISENSSSGIYEYKTDNSHEEITINKSDIKFQTRFYSDLEPI